MSETFSGSGTSSSNRPQVIIPGASRAEVKGLAMGAARAKGWTLIKSTDDMLVMQRPLDNASPTAVALGAANSAIPPVIEVTSFFSEQSGGVNVALAAVLVSQPPGERSPKRLDYTENYRDALTRSLQSLRSDWTANGQRVAQALPPLSSAPQGAPPPDASGDRPQAQAWGPTEAKEPAESESAPSASPAPAPSPYAAPEPVSPPVVAAPAPQAPPRQSTTAPAPIVDGSSALVGSGATVTPLPSDRLTLPSPAPEPVASRDNMLTLSQASGTGTWAYYAEQYARLRGCNVADSGSQLIETRADGEIHKVACVGSDSFLLKCQNGVCRGLE